MQWSHPQTQGDPPSGRAWHSATMVGQQLVIFGGEDRRFRHTGGERVTLRMNDIHLLDLKAMQWTGVKPPGECPAQRCGHSAIFIDLIRPHLLWKSGLFVWGGTGGGLLSGAEEMHFLEEGEEEQLQRRELMVKWSEKAKIRRKIEMQKKERARKNKEGRRRKEERR